MSTLALHCPGSDRPLAAALAVALVSTLACLSLVACDAAAGPHPDAAAVAAAAPAAPAPAARAAAAPAVSEFQGRTPLWSRGGAALEQYLPDTDPSHAAIGAYRD